MRTDMLTMLMKKDFKDMLKNMSILPVLLIGPFLAILMSKVVGNAHPADTLPMWVLYGIAMVGIMVPGMTVAEEKEKATLDSLLVSPATSNEIIVAKLLFSVITIVFVSLLTILPNGGLMGNQFLMWWGIVFGAVFFTQIGLIVGLFTKNQVAAGTFMTPAMLLFILLPMLMGIAPAFIKTIIQYSPSLNIMEISRAGMLSQGLPQVWKHILCLFAWNGVAYFFTRWGFRHQFR